MATRLASSPCHQVLMQSGRTAAPDPEGTGTGCEFAVCCKSDEAATTPEATMVVLVIKFLLFIYVFGFLEKCPYLSYYSFIWAKAH
jgi:hypothetical protein